jgi:hypothetical protein
MATELHPEGRTGRVASVPEAPGIRDVTSLHVEHPAALPVVLNGFTVTFAAVIHYKVLYVI